MRHEPSNLFLVALMLLAAIFAASIAHAQSRPEEGGLPERREIHKTYKLAPGDTVEVSMIAGPVEIETTNSDTANVDIFESGQTRRDLECYKTVVEQISTRLVIRHEQSCSNVNDHQRVKLTLPRSVNMSLENIAGFIHVGAIDGMLRLSSIAGPATVERVQTAKILSLAKGLTMGLVQPAGQGIQISSIMGGIDLSIGDGVHTNIAVTSLNGEIDAPGASVTKINDSSFNVRIGSGGKPISVSSIQGKIRIHR